MNRRWSLHLIGLILSFIGGVFSLPLKHICNLSLESYLVVLCWAQYRQAWNLDLSRLSHLSEVLLQLPTQVQILRNPAWDRFHRCHYRIMEGNPPGSRTQVEGPFKCYRQAKTLPALNLDSGVAFVSGTCKLVRSYITTALLALLFVIVGICL